MTYRESGNHAPTELCPHPEWWTANDPYSTEIEVSMLVAAFVKALQPEFVVEIGSHMGYTTERIARVIQENGHGHFDSLEIDPGMRDNAKERCKDLPVNIILVNSQQYMPPTIIDFLFIDGHESLRAQDLIQFTPLLSKHATVIAHDMDYYVTERDIMLEVWKGNHILLHTPRGLLILTR